ncbi:rCG24858 [Rattus norvegicus]|uniref:RCG24858 n=1 Tax=Rattus norvegicus TaxID=10116 RepID=A6JCM8_RAT|nr:rCG24858 [Rattus norvegicus]
MSCKETGQVLFPFGLHSSKIVLQGVSFWPLIPFSLLCDLQTKGTIQNLDLSLFV